MLISDLQNAFGVKNENEYVHAGIMHTYGYLFSVLNTPYGFKRKRWVDPTLNVGFKLKDQSLGVNPKSGTLLSNATYFAGKIAFSEKENLIALDQLQNVSSEIKNFSYHQLSIETLDEVVTSPKSLDLIIRTSLVKLIEKNKNEENDYLLIYSFKNKKTKSEKLITAFPIKRDAYLKIIDSLSLGEDRPILIRYNGYFDIEKNTRLSGNRSIVGVLPSKM